MAVLAGGDADRPLENAGEMALVGEAGEHGGLGGRKALCQQLDDAGDPDGFQVAAWGDSPAAGESAQQPVFADAGAVCQLVRA